MWKKYKYEILSFILILGILITTVKLPERADAAGNDVTALIQPVVKTVLQNGVVVPDGNMIDLNAKLLVKVEFNVPVKRDDPAPVSYVEKGDKAKIDIGGGIRLKPSDNPQIAVVKDVATQKKIGTATFKNKPNPADGIELEFNFDGEDEVFEEHREVKVSVTGNFDLDTDNLIPDPSNPPSTIAILGKSYPIKPIKDEVSIAKKGEVDYLNSRSVKWTINVERKALGRDISLGGYKIVDDLLKTREYITGSFKLNGSPATPVYNAGSKTLSFDFPAGTVSPAVIEFNTLMNNEEFTKKYKASNTASVYKGAEKLKSATAEVDWEAKFGSKKAKDQGGGVLYKREGNDYFIDWEIVFNEKPYTLNNVTIKDELKDEELGKLGQEFVSAKLWKWNSGINDWEDAGKTWSTEPPTKMYDIGNISYKIKLTIRTKITGLTSSSWNTRNKFVNGVTIRWNGNTEGAEFFGEVGFGDNGVTKSAKFAQDGNGKLYVDFDTEWMGDLKPNSSINPNTSYIYDCMIFDNTVETWKLRDGVTQFTLKDESDNVVAGLESGVDKKKLIPYHNRFLKWSGWVNKPSNLQSKIYKMYIGTKHIGDILEIKGFSSTDENKNKFSFKAKQTAINILMKSETAYNIIYFAQGNQIVESDYTWPKYNAKLLKKQALTADAGKELTDIASTYSADTVNKDVFDTVTNKGKDNADAAYNKEDKSIIYRISVNAAGINGIGEQTGDIVVKDKLPTGWEFVDIKAGEKFLIYGGTAYTDSASTDATVKAEGSPVTLNAPDFTSDFATPGEAEFTFKNIDKPYVILLKAKLTDTNQYLNHQGEVTNTASLTMKNELLKSEQKVNIDERFLTKDYNADTIEEGYLTWKIEYKPYEFVTPSGDVVLEDELKQGIELRRYKNPEGFVFKGDNYKIVEGRHINGVFTPERTLTTADMEAIMQYNSATRIFTIKLPERTKSYLISYITDLKDKASREKVENIVTVKEGTSSINVVTPKEYIISDAYGSGTMKGFNRMRIVKTDKDGGKLKDAEFELTRVTPTPGAPIAIKTDANGIADFNYLLPGTYKFREKAAPAGYVLDAKVYDVTVRELEVGFDVSIDTQGNDKIAVEGNVLTIKNEKVPITPSGGGGENPPPTIPEDPGKPDKPKEPEKPNKPEEPETPDPEEPEEPEDPEDPEEPEDPNPTPDIPIYPINRVPDPNDPNSPDEIFVVDEDGTPLGKYIKKTKPNGEKEWVLEEDGTPLGFTRLPQTGGENDTVYYIAGAGMLLAGTVFALKKRKDDEDTESEET